MLPFLTYPLALIGLVALPALVAVYILRNRFRQMPVSSLMLWQFYTRSREGGTKINKLKVPLIFFLELLVLLLLVVAATGPRWQLAQHRKPLIVVLDDSQSMVAAQAQGTARERAAEALRQIMEQESPLSVRLILAGASPTAGGLLPPRWDRVAERLQEWSCLAPAAALDSAIGLAADIAERQANILVLTDHAPPRPAAVAGRIQWRAFGTSLGNVGFVHASREAVEDVDRCFFEIVNLAGEPQSTRYTLRAGDQVLKDEVIQMEAGGRRRLLFEIPGSARVVKAELGRDSLSGDNVVFLVPPERKRIRVANGIQSEPLRTAVARALEATGLESAISREPELALTDQRSIAPGTNTWTLQVLPGEEPKSFTGPFVVDRSHPLTAGLDLENVIWGAGSTTNQAGSVPVITAGNTLLLSERSLGEDKRLVQVWLDPKISTLQNTPNGPVLFWNLLQWRSAESPGIRERNIRLGAEAKVRTSGALTSVLRPDGMIQELPAPGRELVVETPVPGVYEVRSEEARHYFAANLLSADESDLRRRSGGQWGRWQTEEEVHLEYASVLWIFLVGALALLVGHLYAVTRGKGGQ